MNPNATFHSFKRSGKWYASGRGFLSPEVFTASFDRNGRRERILQDNEGKFPGLSGRGDDFTFVVFGDDDLSYGFPLMLYSDIEPPKVFP